MGRVSYLNLSDFEKLTVVFIWKIEDSTFEGWGEDGWVAEDLSPVGKLNAGGRYVFPGFAASSLAGLWSPILG